MYQRERSDKTPPPTSSRQGTKPYAYQLIDVFAERPFSGAPLAVFTDSRGLDNLTMLALSRELNRPRTVFISHEDTSRSPQVRIFSPHGELPSAQYPTIAAAFALALDQGSKRSSPPQSRMVFESASGPVSVSSFARVMTVRQAAPGLGAVYEDVDAVLGTLGLQEAQRMQGVPIQAASSGVPYLMVPLRNRSALQSIRFREDIWYRTLRHFAAPKILAFTIETDRSGSSAKMRVFAPDVGIMEDPATETACGPLAGYLARYGLMSAESPQMLLFEQGAEIGRPSFLHVAVERDSDSITDVRVGGQCVLVGEGYIVAPTTDLSPPNPSP